MFFFVFRYEYTTNICHLQVFGCLFSFFHVFSVVLVPIRRVRQVFYRATVT